MRTQLSQTPIANDILLGKALELHPEPSAAIVPLEVRIPANCLLSPPVHAQVVGSQLIAGSVK